MPDKFYDKYSQSDVKAALKSMYRGFCCYCETYIEVVAYANIEHRKPKRKYPDWTFEWDNLHLACPICNTAKSDKYDEGQPILDAVVDVPITDYLTYEISEVGIYRKWRCERGRTTIVDADLNRGILKMNRTKVYLKTMGLIEEINVDPTAPGAEIAIDKLNEKCKEDYGSLIEYCMKIFLKDAAV